MELKKYTCGFMFDMSGQVILVRKLKPSWQAGLLNGVGGKTEEGETQNQCMRREWREETGNDHEDWNVIGTLCFSSPCGSAGTQITFFRAFVLAFPEINSVNDIGETLSVFDAKNLPEDIIPNLKWLIPYCLDTGGPGYFTTGWTFKNNE